MTYTPAKPPLPVPLEELRARTPGWRADLDPADRPSVPRLQFDPAAEARVALLEQQPELWPRERSIEHARLTPVFGTACPPKGVSGALRKYAYRRHSEAKAAHWLLLLLADRIEVQGSVLRSLVSGRPDNPVTETGVLAEPSRSGLTSRLGRGRTDVGHQLLDPVIVAAPWVVRAGLAVVAVRGVARVARRSTR